MGKFCSICGRKAELALISSGCAPITYAACEECRENLAESLDVVALWWHLEGGSEASAAYLARVTVWEDGAFVGKDRILAYYEAHREELIADLSKEVELIDDSVPLGEADPIPWDGEERR